MDWDKLRIFHAVADAGSLTHAGDALHLSQSAVSRQIRALEESLDTTLFHRHARGLILTEQGELLFEATSSMNKRLDAAAARIRDSEEEVFGVGALEGVDRLLSVTDNKERAAFIAHGDLGALYWEEDNHCTAEGYALVARTTAEALWELRTQRDYPLIVLDTPPSAHAMDFLEAPSRLLDALDRHDTVDGLQQALFNALADPSPAADAELPRTGVTPATTICIHSGGR